MLFVDKTGYRVAKRAVYSILDSSVVAGNKDNTAKRLGE
jgi:hypothetical protein